jgi:hypothetical protein
VVMGVLQEITYSREMSRGQIMTPHDDGKMSSQVVHSSVNLSSLLITMGMASTGSCEGCCFNGMGTIRSFGLW